MPLLAFVYLNPPSPPLSLYFISLTKIGRKIKLIFHNHASSETPITAKFIPNLLPYSLIAEN